MARTAPAKKRTRTTEPKQATTAKKQKRATKPQLDVDADEDLVEGQDWKEDPGDFIEGAEKATGADANADVDGDAEAGQEVKKGAKNGTKKATQKGTRKGTKSKGDGGEEKAKRVPKGKFGTMGKHSLKPPKASAEKAPPVVYQFPEIIQEPVDISFIELLPNDIATMDLLPSSLRQTSHDQKILNHLSEQLGDPSDGISLHSNPRLVARKLSRGRTFKFLLRQYREKDKHNYIVRLGALAINLKIPVTEEEMKFLRAALVLAPVGPDANEQLQIAFGPGMSQAEWQKEKKKVIKEDIEERKHGRSSRFYTPRTFKDD